VIESRLIELRRRRAPQREGKPFALTPAQALLRKIVLDSVISPYSRHNHAKALDDLFAFAASPTSLPGGSEGVAGRHGVAVSLDY
jgi:hypothetical protein